MNSVIHGKLKYWKDDEKLRAALRSFVATNQKHKKIFGLVCRDFPDYE